MYKSSAQCLTNWKRGLDKLLRKFGAHQAVTLLGPARKAKVIRKVLWMAPPLPTRRFIWNFWTFRLEEPSMPLKPDERLRVSGNPPYLPESRTELRVFPENCFRPMEKIKNTKTRAVTFPGKVSGVTSRTFRKRKRKKIDHHGMRIQGSSCLLYQTNICSKSQQSGKLQQMCWKVQIVQSMHFISVFHS